MNIGLFFGTFDPVHAGHLQVANNLIVNNMVNVVWFVVTPMNPFKQNQRISSQEHRITMVKIATQNSPFLQASDLEFALPAPHYTAKTLQYVSAQYKDYNFSIVMGADNYANILSWKDCQYILNNFTIYVYKRNSHKTPSSSSIVNIPGDYIDISSSHIRKHINKIDAKWLNQDVLQYAIKHSLYH